MQEKIQSLRARIDTLNLKILELVSERASVAAEIGALQSSMGSSQYDPVREQAMLDALVAANRGPFDAATVKSLFKQIFQASMQQSQKQEKRAYLTSRATQGTDTVVTVRGVPIGSKHSPVLVAGPCAIESEEQVEAVASQVASRGVKLFRGGAYKPRTDPYSFQGLGEEGLRIGREACDRHDLAFVSEIMTPSDLPLFEEYVDLLQVGARNMQNFHLLRAVGRSSKPVLLKRGLSATIEEWLMAAEYLLNEGNPNVILCERGIRTFEQYTRNTLDVSAVALAKLESHLPVLVDVTHSGGRRDLLVALTKAGLAVGADGIMVEVHPNPAIALSDTKQQIDFPAFDRYLDATGYHAKLSEKRVELYGF
ncbi:MAG: bifunctional 3-deoxy-7-phosphoheptulonate synthase/chorismate mutase [Trueperaceae bacterium]|nr:bifunctional 3-deoxy-7-phosphoheptulonate synthase/chorismate mutase [Trueperaceae bacterium]MCC6310867.1 bifunctional 3-deoxy-7-phosphoheptulonate synthase/chorismate mutase [Trueperaceae bacterium]MCO5173987.1 bifunctional 3-deoxy-7-phosphoheptulonate synthase/chorismate mutase [Trueperaceae bacterium]MCW5819201.1 bifunctional 3-deoxy-7-phosphoheptulonate synthase/chorismate mutase [Trueperaceae bacterium]